MTIGSSSGLFGGDPPAASVAPCAKSLRSRPRFLKRDPHGRANQRRKPLLREVFASIKLAALRPAVGLTRDVSISFVRFWCEYDDRSILVRANRNPVFLIGSSMLSMHSSSGYDAPDLFHSQNDFTFRTKDEITRSFWRMSKRSIPRT